jgi:hypothetical protein
MQQVFIDPSIHIVALSENITGLRGDVCAKPLHQFLRVQLGVPVVI